jgi:4-hydroxybenzoate polyprenyltransferase
MSDLDTDKQNTPILNYVTKRLVISGGIMLGVLGLLLSFFVMHVIFILAFEVLVVIVVVAQVVLLFRFLLRHRGAIAAERAAKLN